MEQLVCQTFSFAVSEAQTLDVCCSIVVHSQESVEKATAAALAAHQDRVQKKFSAVYTYP